MAEKELMCSHHKGKKRKMFFWFCGSLLVLIFLVLLTILIVWAVLQPKKPRFVLQDATVFVLNVSAPNVISTIIQITVAARNPNSRIGIYYDRLHVYGVYNYQQITLHTSIPPTYQGHKDVNLWSPFIYGTNVPVAPDNGISLAKDKTNGAVSLKFKLDGRVKWKVGTFISGHYHLHVTCPVVIPLNDDVNAYGGAIIVANNAIKYKVYQSCSVSV